MKNIGVIGIVLFIAAASGCQAVLKKMYGIKNPDIESTKTVLKKARKFGLDTANIATVQFPTLMYLTARATTSNTVQMIRHATQDCFNLFRHLLPAEYIIKQVKQICAKSRQSSVM
jgi:hypothetical protein